MFEFVIFCIIFSFLSLLGIGFWFYFIVHGIPEMVRNIKYEIECENYFSTYFLTILYLMFSIFVIGGIPSIMYQVWGPFRAHVYKSNVVDEPSTKVIHYDVPQEIRVDSEFIHDDKIIHKESI